MLFWSQTTTLEIIDSIDEDTILSAKDDSRACEKDLKLNDPLLSSSQCYLFESPPSSSHSSSIPSSPSSISSSSSSGKRSKHKLSPFEIHQNSDDDDDDFVMCTKQLRRKNNKYLIDRERSCEKEKDNETWDSYPYDAKDSSINIKDPMMSTTHSPLHFLNDNNYMDHMFFSTSLSTDDSIDLCTILKTEYDGEIMIG